MHVTGDFRSGPLHPTGTIIVQALLRLQGAYVVVGLRTL
jgi:hypothetical protein